MSSSIQVTKDDVDRLYDLVFSKRLEKQAQLKETGFGAIGGAGLGALLSFLTPKDKDESRMGRLLRYVLGGAAMGGIAGLGVGSSKSMFGAKPENKPGQPEVRDAPQTEVVQDKEAPPGQTWAEFGDDLAKNTNWNAVFGAGKGYGAGYVGAKATGAGARAYDFLAGYGANHGISVADPKTIVKKPYQEPIMNMSEGVAKPSDVNPFKESFTPSQVTRDTFKNNFANNKRLSALANVSSGGAAKDVSAVLKANVEAGLLTKDQAGFIERMTAPTKDPAIILERAKTPATKINEARAMLDTARKNVGTARSSMRAAGNVDLALATKSRGGRALTGVGKHARKIGLLGAILGALMEPAPEQGVISVK